MSSYFFDHIDRKPGNREFINELNKYADENKTLIYILSSPLTDQKYIYDYSEYLILLSPKHKILVVDYGNNELEFNDLIEDLIEDVASLSDKYNYRTVIGRPRSWRDLLQITSSDLNQININDLISSLTLVDNSDIKKIDLLISLFIGSINDVDRVKKEIPSTILDKVKQKIQLFDGDQTRFIYKNLDKKRITIQGMSGTGKTELLLHKLKDLYTKDDDSRIFFTCHNRILADNLKKRIPSFFNFMKVEQQIDWEDRLWCANAWGNRSNPDSGAYRYICWYYNIPFYNFSHVTFNRACQIAIEEIKSKYDDKQEEFSYAFTYMLVDESQDFDEAFFDLCELVTQKNVYIAGDIFQSIFDENISNTIAPDFLLGKCYRTDPKTLMFAHALGMGLFEKIKLRWLEEKEWKDCGYNVEIKQDESNQSQYILSREPLRRFEDLDDTFESISIVPPKVSYSDTVINIIHEIRKINSTLLPDDIGIIFLDSDNDMYKFADELSVKIPHEFKWGVNKAYETKEKLSDSVLISNKNNVKGLEFPFVICITRKIKDSHSYRNSLYTMLSRSFIKSYLVIPPSSFSDFTKEMQDGLHEIITTQKMTIIEPSEEEKINIQTRFKSSLRRLSYHDMMIEIFKELKVQKKYHEKLMGALQQFDLMESDPDIVKDFIKENLKYLKNQ